MARWRHLLRAPSHTDRRELFLVAHPLPPRQIARPPPIVAEEAQGRGRGLPMPRQAPRAEFVENEMDKGEVGRGGQCHRMLEAHPGQSSPPISSSTVFVGEALVRSARSTRNALKWTCARNTAHPPEISTVHRCASNVYGGKYAGRGRGS